MRKKRVARIGAVVFGACCSLPALAFGQLPSASTRALGMADNATAAASGYAAVAWNPALLGIPEHGGASFALLPVRGVAGLDPVTLKDLADFQGEFVPATVRERWLQTIETEGSEQGTAGGDATFLAVQFGRFGLQAGSIVRAVTDLSPGAAELLLFGNAGRTGEAREFPMGDSELRAFAASTVAASYAFPLPAAAGTRMSLGITAKYTVGHFLLLGEDAGSQVTSDPSIQLNFPLVGTSIDNSDANSGNGVGFDVGFAMRQGSLTFAAAVQNVINTFSWDESKLTFREGRATFDGGSKESDFDEQAFANAPTGLRQLADDAKFKPVIALGAALDASAKLTVSADIRTRVGDTSIEQAPKLHAGIGAEFRPAPVLPLRAGVAAVTGGYLISGGVGLYLGPMSLGVSVASRKTDLGKDMLTMITLISTGSR